jgi:hypothetical protein
MEVFNGDDFDNCGFYENALSLLSHKKRGKDGRWPKGDSNLSIDGTTFKLWCIDGSRHNIDVVFDEQGLDKSLIPNHRANAAIFAGRFLSREFNHVDVDSNNQQLKDSWGSCFIVGDLICRIPQGTPIPDLNVFGDNPIEFILSSRLPCPAMIREHGAQVAKNMMSYNMMKSPPNTMDEVMNPRWERTTYELIPKECSSKVYIRLLKSWNIDLPSRLLEKAS